MVNMKKYFRKEVKIEACKLTAVYIIFIVSYISRTVAEVLSYIDIIEHSAIFFNIGYIFWDVIPLSMIMVYHCMCFTAED